MNPDTGVVIKYVNLDGIYFGEGCTIFNNKLYVVTWKEKTGFIFNPDTLEKESKFSFSSTRNEGWGLTHDENYIIMSDGSNNLHFYDKDFKLIKTVSVNYQQQPISNLNELENINGLIWANIWYKNFIVVINPSTGEVVHTIDCKELVKKKGSGGDVLNGILYHNNEVYLSGKLWSKIFVVDFEKLPKK